MFRKIFGIIALLTLCLTLAACDSESDAGSLTQPPSTAPEPTTITVSYGLNPTLAFEVGETRLICFKVESDYTVSSNELIVLVGDDDVIEVNYYDSSSKYFYYQVTALDAGSTTLTVKLDDGDEQTSETVSVKVTKPGPASAVITDRVMTHVNTYVGETENIYIKIVGDETYTQENVDIVISSDTALTAEYVDAAYSYLHYKLTAHEAGKVTLYVATKSGKRISDEITVQIYSSGDEIEDAVIEYVGNLKSKIYHIKGCGNAGKINPANLVSEKTKEWFEENEYTPCENCKP